MISLYAPGSGILHRMPAGTKMLLLAVGALGLSLWHAGAAGGVAVVCAVGSLFPISGLPLRMLSHALWQLRWLVLVLGGALWLFSGAEVAIANTARVVSLLLLAELVTRTTRTGDMLTVLRRMLRPLRRFGVDPDAVGLALTLTIAMIPVVAGLADQVRDAQRARGVRLGPLAALPLLVLTLRQADEVGEAMVARGVVESLPPAR